MTNPISYHLSGKILLSPQHYNLFNIPSNPGYKYLTCQVAQVEGLLVLNRSRVNELTGKGEDIELFGFVACKMDGHVAICRVGINLETIGFRQGNAANHGSVRGCGPAFTKVVVKVVGKQ